MTTKMTTEGWNTNVVFTFVFGFLFLILANVAVAQEREVNVVPASAGISASLREVKPVIVVPAPLAKAMVTGKIESEKARKISGAKPIAVQTNMVWFPVNPGPLTENCDLSNFQTSNGTLYPTGSPDICNGNRYCCAIGYPVNQCTENEDGSYTLNPGATGASIARQGQLE